jgi:predicted DNA-binding protein
MAAIKRKSQRPRATSSSRASVTFPPDIYRTLEDLAKQKKVSIAWIVREAVEKYVSDLTPLFSARKE